MTRQNVSAEFQSPRWVVRALSFFPPFLPLLPCSPFVNCSVSSSTIWSHASVFRVKRYVHGTSFETASLRISADISSEITLKIIKRTGISSLLVCHKSQLVISLSAHNNVSRRDDGVAELKLFSSSRLAGAPSSFASLRECFCFLSMRFSRSANRLIVRGSLDRHRNRTIDRRSSVLSSFIVVNARGRSRA